MSTRTRQFSVLLWALMGACLLDAGCMTSYPCKDVIPADVPKELVKVSMPAYVIEPPDILLIDAVRVVPVPPYKIKALDQLLIQATNVLPTEPISGIYGVDPNGTVNLGISYGSVVVIDMSIEDAQAAILKHLKTIVKDPQVLVSLAQSGIMEQIRGEHLVRPDGTVGLGVYGDVYITGKTIAEARKALETHLSKYLSKPEISLDVYAYNSKVYYVISDNGGFGEQIARLPITGNETVLDALSQIGGLPSTASKKKIWIARPAPDQSCGEQILPIDYKAITRGAVTATNYQILPGDRLYVASEPLIVLDSWLTKIFTPVERVFGTLILGDRTINLLRGQNNGGGGGTGNGLGF